MKAIALIVTLSFAACATLPAIPEESTNVYFAEAGSDRTTGRLMKDSAERCRDRLVELRNSASHYRLTTTVLSLLSGSIGVFAGTASASLSGDRASDVKALGVTAAVAAGWTAVITPVLRADAREQAYLTAYFRWQTANVRLRSLYTADPLTVKTDASLGGDEIEVSSVRAERFRQAWSAMANDLDVCAGSSFR
jgi:hypothetical protein